MAEEVKNLPPPSKFQKPLLLFLIIMVILGTFSLAVMLAFSLGKSQKQEPVSTAAPPISLSPIPEVSPSPAPSPSPADETVLIKQAVYKLTGLNETKAEVTINKNTGQFATGNIKEFEAVGGAYWIAAKSGAAGWVGVYAGQATPKCSEIAPYNFPKDMVPECLDAGGNVVSR